MFNTLKNFLKYFLNMDLQKIIPEIKISGFYAFCPVTGVKAPLQSFGGGF
jgi:hypothetical protein